MNWKAGFDTQKYKCDNINKKIRFKILLEALFRNLYYLIRRKKISITHTASDDKRNSDIFINVNGSLFHRDKATVSVFDSGFLLGDGVWEGIRLHKGTWLFFYDHMNRLREAMSAIEIELSIGEKEIFEEMERTRQANSMETDVYARLMVTRGKKSKPFQHPSFSVYGATWVIIMEHSRPSVRLSNAGVKLATVPQVRGLPMTQDPKLNSHSKLNCVIACLQSSRAGADEALMLDPNGFVNTTNSCNFFIVRNGEVWTSTGDYCMNGVTRKKIIDICKSDGIPIYEKNYSLLEVYSADEAFLSGTFGGVTVVSEVDGRILDKDEGPLTKRIRSIYEDLVEKYRY